MSDVTSINRANLKPNPKKPIVPSPIIPAQRKNGVTSGVRKGGSEHLLTYMAGLGMGDGNVVLEWGEGDGKA
jgi:hypothetical protein